jgi:hypothetical protein
MRVNGMKPPEIARNLEWNSSSRTSTCGGSTGLNDLSELQRWAVKWGLDEMPDLRTIRRYRGPSFRDRVELPSGRHGSESGGHCRAKRQKF